MLKALKYRADLINDVSGFNYEKQSLSKLKKYNVAKVLHHMQGTPKQCKINQNTKMFC